jgi:hypothetical protein
MWFGAQAAGKLVDVLFDPKTRDSFGVEDAALPKSLGFNGPLFELMEQPGNDHYLARFGGATAALSAFSSPNAVLEGKFFSQRMLSSAINF